MACARAPYAAGTSKLPPRNVLFHSSLPNSRWMVVNTLVQGAVCPCAARFAPYVVVDSPARYSIRLAASVVLKVLGTTNQGSAPIVWQSCRKSYRPYSMLVIDVE